MALIKMESGDSQRPVTQKLPTCHTCGQKKAGVFTISPNGRPECGDCAALRGRPIPGG